MKILHIFNITKGTFFAKLLIDCINKNFMSDESLHFFCVRDKEFYRSCKFDNVFLDLDEGHIVKKYLNDFDYVFLHGLNSLSELDELPKPYLKKIILRTWGGSKGLYSIHRKNLFLYLKDFCKKSHYLRIINQMPYVCGANTIDMIDMRQKIEHFREFPYPIPHDYEVISQNMNDCSTDALNIMVGHSGWKTDKHDAVLSKLRVLKDKNIKIFVPLTYGVQDYSNNLIIKWQKVFNDKIIFLTNQLSTIDYNNLVSRIDLFFLIGDRSYALGNIEIALRNRVNIVLSKSGVLHQGFVKEKINHYVFEKLSLLSDFSHFKQKLNPSLNTGIVSNYDSDIQKLKDLFTMLKTKE